MYHVNQDVVVKENGVLYRTGDLGVITEVEPPLDGRTDYFVWAKISTKRHGEIHEVFLIDDRFPEKAKIKER